MLWLAQTTQHADTGMMSWTLGQWTTFVGLITAFIAATLLPAVLTILGKIKEVRTVATSAAAAAVTANTTANTATAVANTAHDVSVRNVDRILTLSQNMPSPSQVLTPLLNATPESIRAAFEQQSKAEARLPPAKLP